jgi:SAM-dependent methyltransferase
VPATHHPIGRPIRAELRGARLALLGSARGDVLEVGARNGANLRHYSIAITSLTVTEGQRARFRRLARRSARLAPNVVALRAPVEDLPFNDASFDTVVSTFALCRADDQPRAVREIHRVLRADGALVFIEHASDASPTAEPLDGNKPLRWRFAGCDPTRPTVASLRKGGFALSDVRPIGAGHVRRGAVCIAGVARPIAGRRYATV